MATETAMQVLDSAVETAGVSTITATRTPANPRRGTIYNPATFAAAVPIWFHRLQDGRYLAIFKSRWHTATATYDIGPLMFSAHSESGPCYAFIDPTTGTIEGPYDWPDLDVINSAVSRNDYLFAVGELNGTPVVQHFIITRFGGLQPQGSEVVPLGFNLGLFADGHHLYVFGDNGAGRLARIRKNWGRIGINNDPQFQWEYQGEKGWYTNVDEATPMKSDGNTYIPAAGPVSVAKHLRWFYLTAVTHSSGSYYAKTYSARDIDQRWRWYGDVAALGLDADYLGGGAYLQPQLVVTSDLLPDGTTTGFPYVISQRVAAGSNRAILTEWNIVSV